MGRRRDEGAKSRERRNREPAMRQDRPEVTSLDGTKPGFDVQARRQTEIQPIL